MSFLLLLFWALPIRAAELDGTWQTACSQNATRTEIFAAESVTLVERNFADTSCTKLGIELESAGVFTADTDPLASGFRSLDFEFRAVRITLFSQEYLDFFAAKKMCGFSDWAIGETKEVTGLACDIFGTGNLVNLPKAGELRYGIFRHQGDELFFGKLSPAENALSPNARPTAWDSVPYRSCSNPATR